MPEGSFTIVLPAGLEKATNEIIDYFKSNGFSSYKLEKNATYPCIAYDEYLELDFGRLVEFLKSIINGRTWVRLYEWNEYGEEAFTLVKKQEHWRELVCEDGESYGTFGAYKNWHKGLKGFWMGIQERADISALEKEYTGADSAGKPLKVTKKSIVELLGDAGSFLGKGVVIPFGKPSLDWFVQEHQFLAEKIAQQTDYYPDDKKIHFKKSYALQSNRGFVWYWTSGGKHVFLLFCFVEDDFILQERVISSVEMTVDEAIVVALFSSHLNEESWDEGFETDQPESTYLHRFLMDMNYSSLELRSDMEIHDGQVVCGRLTTLKEVAGRLCVEINNDFVTIEDCSFMSNLSPYVDKHNLDLKAGLNCKVKMVLQSRELVQRLTAVHVLDLSGSRSKTLVKWEEDWDTVSVLS